MKIKGLEGLSEEQIRDELDRGGKFVLYTYAVSLLIVSFKRPSSIYFIRPGQGRFFKGLPFSLISMLFGWWGIPHGIIYTIGSLVTNFGGGKDVTNEILAGLNNAT